MAALAVTADHRHEGADAVDHARYVDADHPVPFLGADVLDPRAVHRDAGVVHRDMQLAEGLLGRSPRGRDGRCIGHIDRHADRLGTQRFDVLTRRRQPIRLQVGQHEVHPRAGKGLCDAQADTGSGTGHDRGLSLQFQLDPPHPSPPSGGGDDTPGTTHRQHGRQGNRVKGDFPVIASSHRPAVADPRWMEPAPTVMAGLARLAPAMTMKVTLKADPGSLLGPETK